MKRKVKQNGSLIRKDPRNHHSLTNQLQTLFVLLLFMHFTEMLNAQDYTSKICAQFDSAGPAVYSGGLFTLDTSYSPSNSTWEVDWNERWVFSDLLKFQHPTDPSKSFEMRIGKGGQVFSFRGAFGEALPPQWRPSFDQQGNNLSPDTSGVLNGTVQSHLGNWAPWNDEVWQIVGSDQNDGESASSKVKTQNIHQAGSYMNNFSHRASDHDQTPFYSPVVQSYFDSSAQTYTVVNWAQSENPPYVYDPTDCAPCFLDPFKPSVLFYTRYKNLGEGVIQADFMIYNWHPSRAIDYWNVPWVAVRNSTLPYAFVSNDFSDASKFEALNSEPGYVQYSNNDLPEFKDGAVRKLKPSGLYDENHNGSSGWFAFSNAVGGNGPSLAFVTAKTSTWNSKAYGDLRYGTAMAATGVRDLTIFSRRSISGQTDPITGLKPWGIYKGQSIIGRYFIVVDQSIDAVVQQIISRNLADSARIEKRIVYSSESDSIHYQILFAQNKTAVKEVARNNSNLTLKSAPFEGSSPVFILNGSGISRITSDPYYYSLKPYDGKVESWELIGFSSGVIDIDPSTVVGIEKPIKKISAYPNPTGSTVHLSANTVIDAVGVTDLQGRTLHPPVLIQRTSATIDLSYLPPALYLIEANQQKFRIIKN